MGSRSRRRTRASGAAVSGPRRPALPVTREVRRTLAAYLAGALVLAVAVLLGTLLLAGTLAPWLVLVVITAAAWGLHRWVGASLADVALGDEERVLRLMATGLLILVVGFAILAAALLSL